MSVTLAFNRKALLMMLLIGFAISNIVVAVSSSYAVIYTYITLLVELIAFGGGIGVALLIFGIGSVISVIVSAKYIDAYLRPIIVIMLGIGGISMAMFLAFKGTMIVSHAAFFLWGLAFGPLVTMYQTAVSKQVEEARDVATSVQSSVFNFSIMIATWVGGLLLSDFPRAGVKRIVYQSLVCFVVAIIIAFFAKRTLRSSSASPVKPYFRPSPLLAVRDAPDRSVAVVGQFQADEILAHRPLPARVRRVNPRLMHRANLAFSRVGRIAAGGLRQESPSKLAGALELDEGSFTSDTGLATGRMRFGPKADVSSGDSDPAHPDLDTFNPLCTRGNYFGASAVLGPLNLVDVHPTLESPFPTEYY